MSEEFAEAPASPDVQSGGLADRQWRTPTRGEVLFTGADIIVRGYFPDKAAALVISFTSRMENRAKSHRNEGFGERFLDANGLAYLCFISRRNHWWQTEEVEAAYTDIDRKYDLTRYGRVITYGSSMGAYGALIFSRLFRADTVLAFSPQASISPNALPIHPQWQVDMEKTPVILEPMGRGLSGTGQIVIAFDPLNQFDLTHVRALEAIRPCTRLVVPMSGHRTSLLLHESNMLKSIVLAGVESPVNVRQLRQTVRDKRRSSSRYWAVLAARLKSRGRLDAAAQVEKRALDCLIAEAPSAANIQQAARRYVERLIAANQKEVAVEFARDWAEAHSAECEAHSTYSRALVSFGKIKAGISEARAAVKLKPYDAGLRLQFAVLLAKNGSAEMGARHVRAAIQATGAKSADWLSAARAFADAGDLATSDLAAAKAAHLEG